MKLYFKNFEIYHNISIYLFYFPGAASEPLGSGSAEQRLGTSVLDESETSDPCFGPLSFYILKRRLRASCDVKRLRREKLVSMVGIEN
jgi:hypothetical protein